MVASMSGNDFVLLRPARIVVVVKHPCDLGFVVIGTGQSVVDLLHPFWRPVHYATGQLDDRLARMADVGVVVGKLLGLLVDGIGHFGAAVTDVHAVEAGTGVNEVTDFMVANADDRSAFDDTALERRSEERR